MQYKFILQVRAQRTRTVLTLFIVLDDHDWNSFSSFRSHHSLFCLCVSGLVKQDYLFEQPYNRTKDKPRHFFWGEILKRAGWGKESTTTRTLLSFDADRTSQDVVHAHFKKRSQDNLFGHTFGNTVSPLHHHLHKIIIVRPVCIGFSFPSRTMGYRTTPITSSSYKTNRLHSYLPWFLLTYHYN